MTEQSNFYATTHKRTSLHINRILPILLATLLAACAPAPAAFIPNLNPIQPPIPLTPQPTDCAGSSESKSNSDNVLRVGIHLGTNFNPEIIRAMRKKIDTINCDNPEVLNSFIPVTALVTEDMLMNHDEILQDWIQSMVRNRFLGNFRIITSMINGNWQMPDAKKTYAMGKQFAHIAANIDLPPKLRMMISPFNEPNLLKENSLPPEDFERILVAFRMGLGKPVNVALLYPALSMGPDAYVRANEFLLRSFGSGSAGAGDFDGYEIHVREPDSHSAQADILDQKTMFNQVGSYFPRNPLIVVSEFGPVLPGLAGNDGGCNDPRWGTYAQSMLLDAGNGILVGANVFTASCFDQVDQLYTPLFNYRTGKIIQLVPAQ